MLRTIWVVLVAVFVTLPIATAVALVALVSSASPFVDRLIRLWARSLVRAAGIDLRGDRLETLDPAQRYILVANHYSYFDIPCILAAIDTQPIRFMAKASLFRIPIFGWALSRSGFIPIDRKNRRTAVKSFDLAGQRIRAGNTIVVFPEEGRTKVRQLRPFQRGAFLLAIKSQLPIVPLAVDGTFGVFPVGARAVRPGIVTVRAGVPIQTAGASVREKDRLGDEARGQIVTMLGMSG